jgi:hypothetical protein
VVRKIEGKRRRKYEGALRRRKWMNRKVARRRGTGIERTVGGMEKRTRYEGRHRWEEGKRGGRERKMGGKRGSSSSSSSSSSWRRGKGKFLRPLMKTLA